MSKKRPSLVASKKQRLMDAKTELKEEVGKASPRSKSKKKPPVRTTLLIEPELLHAVQDLALKRKKKGEKPDTFSAIVRKALTDVIFESKKKPRTE